MSSNSMCPDPVRVAQLMVGDLPELEVDAICDHVAGCPACTTILRNLSHEETILDSVSAATNPWIADPDDRDAIEQLIARLQSLSLPAGPIIDSESQNSPSETLRFGVNESTAEAEANINLDQLAMQLLRPPISSGELGWLGSYRVLSVLGCGGMGVVFEAEDLRLGRRVAVKAMQPSHLSRNEYKLRFLREARAAASIDHDNIVPIHQVDEDRDVPFFVMPLLKGESLESRLRRDGRLSVAETVCTGKQIAIGIAAAHARGLIHRDIKPANIWLEDRGERSPRVKILDFGLARHEDDDSQLTQSGSIAGTPAFMAPEQARGDLADARSDLFSLGGVLYCSLAGKPPFTGRNTAAMMFAVINHRPDSLSDIELDIPARLGALVMQLLQKDPALRVQRAGDVAEALEAIEDEVSRQCSAIPGDSNHQINTPTAPAIIDEKDQSPTAASLTACLRRILGGERITRRDAGGSNHRIADGKRRARWVLSSFMVVAVLAVTIWWCRHPKEPVPPIGPSNVPVASIPASSTNVVASPGLDGLGMWLRADLGTDTDVDGGVRLWADQSSKGQHNAVQLVAIHRPKLVPGVLNARPVMTFDGDDSFDLNGQLVQSQEFTIIAVTSYVNVSGKNGSRILVSNWDDLRMHNSVFLGVMEIEGVFPRFTDDLAGNTDQNPQATVRALIHKPERHFQFTARSSKTDAEIFINTNRLVGTGRRLGERDLSGVWRIGTQGAGFEHWSGDLAEILVYDRALNETELQAVWKYLNERYFPTRHQ